MIKTVIGLALATSALLAENAVRVVEVRPTPEPDNVSLRIVFPHKGGVDCSVPAVFEVKLEGYSVGVSDNFERSKEIRKERRGQSLRVVIDDKPYFSVFEPTIDSYNEDEDYFLSILNFTAPYRLEPGLHVVRMFPARSFNESLKNPGCFDMTWFYFREKTGALPIQPDQPFLTYNEPQGKFRVSPDQPVLLDFYITNCELSPDGYKVRFTIDGKDKRMLTKWVPYYIYGLVKGSHTIRLELVDRKNLPVKGQYNDISRTIVIE